MSAYDEDALAAIVAGARARRAARALGADPDLAARLEASEQAIEALRTGLTSAFSAAGVESPGEMQPRRHLRLVKDEQAS